MSISVKRRADAALSGQVWAVAAGVVSLVAAMIVLAIHAWHPVRLVLGTHGSWVAQLAACAGIVALVTLALLVRLRLSQREVIAGARFLLPPGVDGLTGLADRAAFCRSFEQILDTIDHRGGATLLLLDLDLFKEINDTYGHQAGDAVLAEVARRLRFICGPDVPVGRLGGDEFAVLIEGAPEATDITAACRLIIAEVRKPIPYDGHALAVGVSIGFCATQERGTTRDDMMRRADRALYLAKARGKNCAVAFHPDMDRDESQRRYQERELRGALINGEIDIDLQPIFGSDGVTMKGVEALARWNHPYRGRVGPAEFVSLAESCGLIHRLGATILRLACRAAARWEELFVSVNVSPIQFRRSDFVAQVKAALADSGLPADRLVLEITESVMIEDAEHARAVTHELRALGVKIALDDFGTGFSSLSYLRRFNLDTLKVDRSFVADLDSGVEAATILHCVVNLGRALGLKVVAEGVETAEQARFLRAAGCGLMQGYHLARPMTVPEFERRFAGPASRAVALAG
ncbi:putative bifunctional diguanylate cyclase/phosphodiesterase [Phreatobacter oligotrophus]|uniref:putative bifunctional diguanylate cyclase/phosphodiesterase n=1 Tax=Phreatobacter oligotrophus TaxID=1122261 RepID=UPI002356AC2A|nr:bifunctional diguanylate cyclase/phosphodiesterase [Phreatobacter oligotrophus]MBX9992601.1 bifunctional diguanylate cyclase/phosphodiesterase [Phreatobacter oligotrophus]